MIFGKIEYLNLLPFHVFMKRFTRTSSMKMSMEYKKGVPARINTAFYAKRVDAAFISSISAKRSRRVGLGIVAKRSVKSVIVIPNEQYKKDKESASSNVLAQILGLQGEVLIGDKALRYALSHNDYIDMAERWHKQYKLPFVFALLCYHKDAQLYKKIEREFLKRPVKIPGYILTIAARRVGIEESEILEYLQLISYRVDTHAKMGLKKFYKEAAKFI
ncbi:MAG: hypothetical protein JXQ67_00140 [Campylobacterales bacterium]|nr:hypothetical protein [Campylobacterales bacterium]